jgi:restriction system protein
MALWMIRVGKHGEHEQQFLQSGRVSLNWGELTEDLSKRESRADMRELCRTTYPQSTEAKLSNHLGQIWAFVKEMELGDWVVIPSKAKAAVHIAEITGPYVYDATGPLPYRHTRTVKWVTTDVPRSNFDQDILNSLGAIMTICEIRRHDAEKRVREMAKLGWKSPAFPKINVTKSSGTADAEDVGAKDVEMDLEVTARDMIAKLIGRKFCNHDLTRLVDAVLKAQGYATYVSPPGPDKGVDILAAPEPLGFGQPRICVQVKSEDKPIDRPTLDQLIGTMQNFKADQGLLVSWGGFKTSVDREIPAQFFKVRMWDQKRLIDEILQHYDKLDDDIRAELPLKRIWTVAADEDED